MPNLPRDSHARICGSLYNRYTGEGLLLEDGTPVASLQFMQPPPSGIPPVSGFTNFRKEPCQSAAPSPLAVVWSFYLRPMLPSLLRGDTVPSVRQPVLVGYASSHFGVLAPTGITPAQSGALTLAGGPNALLTSLTALAMAGPRLLEPESEIVIDPVPGDRRIVANGADQPAQPAAEPSQPQQPAQPEAKPEQTATSSVAGSKGAPSNSSAPGRSASLSEGEGLRRIQDILKELDIGLSPETVRKIWDYIRANAVPRGRAEIDFLNDPELFGAVLGDVAMNGLNLFKLARSIRHAAKTESSVKLVVEILEAVQSAILAGSPISEGFWNFLSEGQRAALANSLEALQAASAVRADLPAIWERLSVNRCSPK